jgi:hypothetical protein
VGLTSRQDNIGSVRNRGVEGLMSITAVDNDMTTWGLGLNGSVTQNRLESIGSGLPFIPGVLSNTRSQVGYPLFGRFARPILSFADANANGIIEESEVHVGDTAVYLGTAIPTRQLTASSSLSLFHGRLRLATQFDYRGGDQIFNGTELNRCASFANDCRAVNDPTASLSDQARAVAANSTRLGRTIAGFVESGSFVRWRELGATYVLPNAYARGLRAQTASITATGRNLHLFTGYSGVDPEVNASLNGAEGYSDNLTPPPVRYWTLRMALGF